MTVEEALEELERTLAEAETTQEQLDRAIAELQQALANAQTSED
jgi:exonuclease VII small subunit